MNLTHLLTFVLLLACSCRVIPPEPGNPIVLERPWGVATAESPGRAQRLADAVDASLEVFRSLPGYEERTIRIHSVDELRVGFSGFTMHPHDGEAYILVKDEDVGFPGSVAHELVHLCFRKSTQRFPVVVAEGICDHLAQRVFKEQERRNGRGIAAALGYLEQYTLKLVLDVQSRDGLTATFGQIHEYLESLDPPSIEEALRFDDDDWLGAATLDQSAMYGIGWVLVERVGYERLAALADHLDEGGQGPVTPELFLELAGVDPLDPDSLTEVFRSFLDLPAGEPVVITFTRPTQEL